MPDRTWKNLSLEELHADPERYSFSWPSPEARRETRRSVARYGLLRPPLAGLLDARVRVVAGNRRGEILKDLGVGEVAVGLVAEEGPALWDLLLEDQLLGGPLNPVEVGQYLEKRLRDTGETVEKIADTVFPRLGLAPRPAAAEDPRWIAGLPDEHKEAFARGAIPLQGVRLLRRAPREDALAVLELASGQVLGVNKFTEFARWCLEAGWASGQGVREWAERTEIREAIGSGTDLREVVRRLRYPRITRWEEEFTRDVRRARLPSEARIGHARGFEGGSLMCTVSFPGLGQLEETLRELLRALEEGRLGRLERYLG